MGEMISLTAGDGHQLGAYLARPEGAAKGRLVVIQEIFGVNTHIREVCDGFAADGYAVIAPALFDRVEAGIELDYDENGVARGRDLRGEVGWEAVVHDMEAARAHLAGEGPVGVVGYCWGGSVAWLGATELDFACSVGYYGGQINEFNDREPKCPVMLHFGEVDAAIPLDDVEKIREAHSRVPIHVYEGAGHGFNCDRRASYHEEASRIARQRTMAFFAEHLR
jgi:carboxymethylenebutenolidase